MHFCMAIYNELKRLDLAREGMSGKNIGPRRRETQLPQQILTIHICILKSAERDIAV